MYCNSKTYFIKDLLVGYAHEHFDHALILLQGRGRTLKYICREKNPTIYFQKTFLWIIELNCIELFFVPINYLFRGESAVYKEQ